MGRLKSLLLVAATANVLLVGAVQVHGQVRGASRAQSVGYIEGLGRSAASRTFRSYSYGAGSLAKPTPGPGGNILSRSLSGAGSRAIRRSSSPGGSFRAPVAAGVSSSVRLYKPTGFASGIGRSYGTGALRAKQSQAITAAGAYLASFEPVPVTELLASDKPITSFAPDQDSAYTTYIANGERAFKQGDFEEAYRQFKLANYIAGRDPESLLAMTHATFAKSTFGYSEAALYLRWALKYLPELPLVPLKPRAFYGQSPEGVARYVSRVSRLADHLEQSPFDLDGQLLLAYLRWFDGEPQSAVRILKKAAGQAQKDKNDESLEAIRIFLDAVAASGKLAAKPQPTTQAKATKSPDLPSPATGTDKQQDLVRP